jgi:hypothetical protein
MADAEELLTASFDRRSEAWASWGTLDPDVLAHLINPTFMGGPRWPGLRQSFRVARRPDALLVASDGLSDPFDEDEGPSGVNGLGLECYGISSESVEVPQNSWLFDMVWQVSQFVAQHGEIGPLLEELGLLTTEAHGVGIPDEARPRFVGSEGRVGVLLGLVEEPLPATLQGPLSPIRLVSVKLLTQAELDFAIEGDGEGRQELARRFGHSAASSLSRRCVVS